MEDIETVYEENSAAEVEEEEEEKEDIFVYATRDVTSYSETWSDQSALSRLFKLSSHKEYLGSFFYPTIIKEKSCLKFLSYNESMCSVYSEVYNRLRRDHDEQYIRSKLFS